MIVAIVVVAAALAGCSEEERATVPDVVGLEEAEAEDAVTDAGLALGEIEHLPVDDASVEAGEVAAQAPRAGTEVETGAEVALVVAADSEGASKEEDDAPVAKSSSGPVPTAKAEPKPAETKEGPPQAGEIADDQGWTSMPFAW